MNNNVTAIIKTFNRRDLADKLVRSIRKYYPDLSIIVADDSTIESGPMQDCVYYRLPQDVGLSRGRNFLVNKVETRYTLLLDDDFEFSDSTKLGKLQDALDDGFDLAAGRVNGKDHCGLLELNKGVLKYVHGNRGLLHNRPVYDITWNFFMARTEFLRALPRDESLKLCEHTDWFLSAKGKLRCTSLPDVNVLHSRSRPESYRSYRLRGCFYALCFFKKWGITESINFNGRSTRPTDYAHILEKMKVFLAPMR